MPHAPSQFIFTLPSVGATQLQCPSPSVTANHIFALLSTFAPISTVSATFTLGHYSIPIVPNIPIPIAHLDKIMGRVILSTKSDPATYRLEINIKKWGIHFQTIPKISSPPAFVENICARFHLKLTKPAPHIFIKSSPHQIPCNWQEVMKEFPNKIFLPYSASTFSRPSSRKP